MRIRTGIILLATCLVALVSAGVVAGFIATRTLDEPLNISADSARVVVEPGSTLTRVAANLGDRGILPHPSIFSWYAHYKGDATRIKTGEYDVPAGISARELLALLVRGQVVQYEFTIIEGWTVAELLAAMREDEVISSTGIELDQLMAKLNKPNVHPEGQFLPDTYFVTRGSTDFELLQRAHTALVTTLENAWASRTAEAIVTSDYEALILASIIERETSLASERRDISGVFNRRLAKGMRLQADPTVIYGLGTSYDGDIRRIDLQTDTPYNTYTRGGLPPTPIALPGRDAIFAATNPAPGEALYFVATGDPDRSHYFSATLEEHNAAVQRYLNRLRSTEAQNGVPE